MLQTGQRKGPLLENVVCRSARQNGFTGNRRPGTVKKLERAEEKEHVIVRFDEEEPSGAPVSLRNRHGQSATSASE